MEVAGRRTPQQKPAVRAIFTSMPPTSRSAGM
jgi:hypothetical protein